LILRETVRRRALIPLPFALASLKAAFLQLLPNPLLTMDQVRLLKKDNVVSPTAAGLADLGITPTSVEAVIPSYLWRYRARAVCDARAAPNHPSFSEGRDSRPAPSLRRCDTSRKA
jgi:hypothetical protein